jgi:two-component system response regulator YesN
VLKSLFYASTTEETDTTEKEDDGFTKSREHYIENYLFPFFSDVKPEGANLPLPDGASLSGASGRQIIMIGSCRITTLLFDAKKMFPKTIKVLIAEAFAGSASFGDYRNEQFLFIAILPVPLSPPSAGINDKMIEACSRIVKNVRQYYDVSIFIGLSSEGDPTDMLSLLSESQAALKMCFFSEKNFVSRYDRYAAEAQGDPPKISYTRLFDMIDLNQKDAILEYIQNVFRQLRALKNYMQVHDTFIDFLSIGKLIREKYNLQEQASLSESKFNYDTFFDLEFIGDVEFYIYGIFLALLASKQGEKTLYSFIVKKCITFIKNNYSKNITLSDAAKNAEVSHSYLSFIFKQETGINFNIYLSRWRVEQAKKLLKSTNMRIYEVAERVGFSNPYYFSKVFKELTGVSCKDFRDMTIQSD